VIADPEIIKEPSRLLTYASVIKQEINRLNDQVDKVLQIARIEKHGFSSPQGASGPEYPDPGSG
jgi:two-component system phosphate regulon sensor histidine kinase PhoR